MAFGICLPNHGRRINQSIALLTRFLEEGDKMVDRLLKRFPILWLSLFHHAEHSVEGILLDDVVVSTDRVGCLGP